MSLATQAKVILRRAQEIFKDGLVETMEQAIFEATKVLGFGIDAGAMAISEHRSENAMFEQMFSMA